MEQMVVWMNLTSAVFPDIVAGGIPTNSAHNQYSVLSKNLLKESLLQALESLRQKAVSALPDDYSAFPHRHTFRNAIVISVAYSEPVLAEAADAWARDMRNKFALPENSGYDKLQIYQNYGHRDQTMSALYGYEEWRHKRLTTLKNKYDLGGCSMGTMLFLPSFEIGRNNVDGLATK
ncbi:hypothetical protein F5Y19DRAFT_493654 [Xylariaceae sp. FL1651]|nr:hypothetical protein F5Y19DRAFT_493654 [Xylariaceae sp. FL1651]